MPQINNDSQQSAERSAQTKQDIDEVLSKYKNNKELAKKLSDYKLALDNSNLEFISEKKKRLDKEAEDFIHRYRQDILDDETKTYEEKMAVVNAQIKDNLGKSLQKATDAALTNISKISDEIDNRMTTYLETQTAIAAHLTGSGDSISNVYSALEKITGQGLVETNAVYNNLSSLVKQGIVSNVEQKAFLQTLADDIDATFNASDGTLVRLINLQKEDLSSNRLAIEYSLQEFLNQNYETSTYIQTAFQDVSKSLIEMQSLMTSSTAMQTESIIQSYLGSMFSSGMSDSTITSLASAINALGSGDTSNLGSGVSNLILMAAARAGLSYSDMITNGLNASSTESLLQAIASYMAELGGYDSNVVKSQLASAFGVTVSDLVAAKNFESSDPTGEVTDNIYTALLDGFGDLVPLASKIENFLDNIVSSNAMTYSSNGFAYGSHMLANLAIDAAATAVSGITTTKEVNLALVSGSITKDWGDIISATKILNLLPGIITAVGSGISSLVSDNSGASYYYDALLNKNSKISSAGAGFSSTGVTTSASTSISNSDSGDLINSALNSSNKTLENAGITSTEESYTTTDIYKILDGGSIKLFGTWADADYNFSQGISEVVNTEMSTNVAGIALATASIYDLLNTKLDEIITAIDTSGSSSSNYFMEAMDTIRSSFNNI